MFSGVNVGEQVGNGIVCPGTPVTVKPCMADIAITPAPVFTGWPM
jgi:hypothetical protein